MIDYQTKEGRLGERWVGIPVSLTIDGRKIYDRTEKKESKKEKLAYGILALGAVWLTIMYLVLTQHGL